MSFKFVLFNFILQVENVFLMPPGQTAKAKVAKRKFEVAEGDLLTLLNVFNTFKSIDTSSAKHWCSSNFLRYKGWLISEDILISIRSLIRLTKLLFTNLVI